MQYLRQNTAVIVFLGPFTDKTTGVDLEGALTITNERITLVAATDAGSAPTLVLDNVTGATSATANDLNYIASTDAGMMQIELAAADTNRVGRMRLIVTDAANHVPVWEDFFVLPQAIFDWFTGVIVPLPANVTQLLGTAWLTPGVAGTPDVNAKLAGGTAWGSGAITAGSIAADAITAAKIADGAIDAATFAAGAINAAAIAADAIGASELAADAVTEIVNGVLDADMTAHQTTGTLGQAIGDPVADTNTIYKAVVTDAAGATVGVDVVAVKADTAASLADTNELQTDWANGGRLDLILDAAGSAGDPWVTALPGAYGAGTAGKIVGDNVNATISSRASQTTLDAVDDLVDTEVAAIKTDTAAIKVQTDKLAFTVANQVDSNVLDWKGATAPAMTGDAFARLGAPAGASVSADVAAVKVDTAAILVDTGTTLQAEVDAIQAKTDNLPSDPADESLIVAATDAIMARLGAPAGASVSADVAAVKGDTAAILVDTGTTLDARIPAALVGGRIDASVGAMAANVITASALAADAVDEILDDAVGDGTITVRQALRVLIAGMAGKLSGAATTTVTIRNVADTADVVVATVDSNGNRSATTVTP